MVGIDVATVALSIVLLWAGARWLVTAAARLASAAGVSALVVGLTVVAFGTSAPEFAVTLEAAARGRTAVSVGNVIGSNLFNLGIVLGAVAVIRPISVSESLVRRDALVMGATTLLAVVFLANLVVSRIEGVVLSALLVVYLGWLIRDARQPEVSEADGDPTGETDGGDRVAAPSLEAGSLGSPSWLEVPRLLAGLGLVVGGSHLLVGASSSLALHVGISQWVVGVTIVAGGTSLPELVTSIVAARRGDVAIAAGNVIGSNVFNLLGVLGLAAMIRPLPVGPDALVGALLVLALTVVATFLLATGRRLTRLEGVILVLLVAAYWGASLLI